MPQWLMIVIAFLIAYAIWRVGIASIRSFSPPPGASAGGHEVEDVDDLDVFLVCRECGTELKVSRLGELQIPRHCGEKMLVVRRPTVE